MKALLALLVVAVVLGAGRAGADEVAPSLEGADLRVDAAVAMTMLDTRAITGVYVAFDPNAGDAFAQAACDDDGDPVVVVSDAMLRLVARIVVLGRYDRRHATQALEGYASYVAANQAPGKRLLSPPPGTFEAAAPEAGARERFVGALLFVLGRELEHHRARNLVCPHPTATSELGDASWTPAEQLAATTTARAIYPGDAAARDEAAIVKVIASGSEEQVYDVLGFLARFEASSARVVPGYLVTHPRSATRLTNVKALVAKKKATP